MENNEKFKISVMHNEEHPQDMLNFMHACWQKGDFCDITVKVRGRAFRTHRVVLALVSEYFRALLKMDDKASSEVIELTHESITADVFELVLTYAYTSKIEFDGTDDDVIKLAEVSDYLGSIPIKNLCEAELISRINVKNTVCYLVYSDLYDLPHLLLKSNQILTLNYSKLSKQQEFLDMPVRILKRFLENDDLELFDDSDSRTLLSSSERERVILQSVLCFVNENCTRVTSLNGETELLGLFEVVKMLEFDKEYLDKKLFNYEHLKSNEGVLQVLKKVDLYHSNKKNNDGRVVIIPGFWTTQRIDK